jgi:outer membrane protein assembly factor BamB
MAAAWTTALASRASAAPAYDSERAYITLTSGELVAVSLATGVVAWHVPVAETVGAPDAGGGLVFLGYVRRLEARDAGTGAVRWRVETDGALTAPPYWSDGKLLAFTGDGAVAMYKAATGELIWREVFGAAPSARPGTADARVYLPLDDGRLVAVSADKGTTVWQVRFPGRPVSILPSADRVFVACGDKFFYALSSENGKTKWRWRTGAALVGTPSVDAESVYFLSLDGVLRALDRGNGHQRWMTSLASQPTTGPFLCARVLLVPAISGEVPGFLVRDGKAAGSVRLLAEPSVLPRFIPSPDPLKPGRMLVAVDDGRLQLVADLPPLRGTPLPGLPYTRPPVIERSAALQDLTGA